MADRTDLTRAELAPGYSISRIIKGGWQLAGGHGRYDRQQAIADMLAFVDQGITTFDCADIYTGVEQMIGEAVAILGQRDGFDTGRDIQIHTKLVPDLDTLGSITHQDVEAIIDRSLKRLNLERLHMVQFYWWDLSVGHPQESLSVLRQLQQKGKIKMLGCTNWDQNAMQLFTEDGYELVSSQVQYSLLDRRPAGEFTRWCQSNQTGLLCYGVLAGGFLSPGWLGRDDPGFEFDNRSLIKYRLIIEEFGGWELFQQLLGALAEVASQHEVSLSTVAIKYMLDKPGVVGVIIGARTADHLQETLKAHALVLTAQDRQCIETVIAQSTGPAGPVYGLEQDRNGPHGRIMKYNLNSA